MSVEEVTYRAMDRDNFMRAKLKEWEDHADSRASSALLSEIPQWATLARAVSAFAALIFADKELNLRALHFRCACALSLSISETVDDAQGALTPAMNHSVTLLLNQAASQLNSEFRQLGRVGARRKKTGRPTNRSLQARAANSIQHCIEKSLKADMIQLAALSKACELIEAGASPARALLPSAHRGRPSYTDARARSIEYLERLRLFIIRRNSAFVRASSVRRFIQFGAADSQQYPSTAKQVRSARLVLLSREEFLRFYGYSGGLSIPNTNRQIRQFRAEVPATSFEIRRLNRDAAKFFARFGLYEAGRFPGD